MKSAMRRIRGGLGIGLAWAIGAALVGGAIELVDNVLPGVFPWIQRVDMWPQTLAIPGFIGGVIFSIVLGIAARNRRFSELSVPRFAIWGAVAGIVVGGLALSIGAPVAFIGITTFAAALAASGSLTVARMAEKRALPNIHDAEGTLIDAGSRDVRGRRG
jgi:hypothetical protein